MYPVELVVRGSGTHRSLAPVISQIVWPIELIDFLGQRRGRVLSLASVNTLWKTLVKYLFRYLNFDIRTAVSLVGTFCTFHFIRVFSFCAVTIED